MGFRLIRPDTAFSNATIGKQKKRQRDTDRAHLDWIKTLPCVISGERPVDPAHIRYADRVYGKREVGKAEKPDDKWVVPLCRRLHDEQHSGSEKLFWLRHGLDPLRVALALYINTGDDDQAMVILQEAWAIRKTFEARRSGFNPVTGEIL